MQYLFKIKYLRKQWVKSLVILSTCIISFLLAQILSITMYPSNSLSQAQEVSALPPCSAIPRLLEPPDPNALSKPPAPAVPQSAPAPKIDRVGMPNNYQNNYKLIYVVDKPDSNQVRVICGNNLAVSAKLGEPFPYGSIFVMEIYRAKQDSQGNVVKDEKGQFIREALAAIYVQRKEKGFGVDYLENRSGEWEYIGYQPDQTYWPTGAPGKTNACAACHLKLVGKDQDFVFSQN
ncbi:hypothetical protein NIES22_55120 [Calothrix brevissima NIES-22]|nr:hypothetical protein NIES22_55120 [Calothrix brevissima NIES-22]